MKMFSMLATAWMAALLQTAGFAQQAPANAGNQPAATTSVGTSQSPEKAADRDKSPTDRLNEHLPKWLRFSGQIRLRAEGFTGSGFKRDSDDAYVLERLRLNMKIQPTTWVKFHFQAEDAHIFGQSQVAHLPPNQDSMDLRLAYVEFGDAEKSPAALRVGRQELEFGGQRLIGSANWINTPRSFDAVMAAFRRPTIRLSVFAASLVKPHDNQFDENTPGSNIYGAYVVLPQLIQQASVEPFIFWRRQSGLLTESKLPGISNFGTYGVRWEGKIQGDWDYGLELAKQYGSLRTDTIAAWAGHWVFGRTFTGAQIKPRIFAEYNYASGDHNSADGTRGTFDQLFASAHDLYGLTDQVGWRNIRHFRTGAEIKPGANVTLGARYNAYCLADPHDALYNAAGAAIARSASATAGSEVGRELDFTGSYKFHKRTLFLAGIGHLFPGDFLKRTTPGVGFTYPYLSINYIF